jgi:hypothetical protein
MKRVTVALSPCAHVACNDIFPKLHANIEYKHTHIHTYAIIYSTTVLCLSSAMRKVPIMSKIVYMSITYKLS